jgi:tetratricopeptide (TPR) repeat protein
VTWTGDADQCLGEWKGDIRYGQNNEPLVFLPPTSSPKQLRDRIARLTDKKYGVGALVDTLYMGVDSYMSCAPGEKNIAEYNDIGFFLAQGGQHEAAMEFYKNLLHVAPDRIPLKINIADSLFALGKYKDARDYYLAYRNAMIAKGSLDKVPARVDARIK